MGDHFSGPRSFSDPAGDITDLFAFPSPRRPGRFTLILDTFPGAAATALFSDVITYRFRIRPLTIDGSAAGPGYLVGEDEQVIDFTFAAPTEDSADNGLIQLGTCTVPGGERVSFKVGEETSADSAGLRIFAGPRLDPFFIDAPHVRSSRQQGKLAFEAQGTNSLEGANLLSIVLEFDTSTVFPADFGPLLAVVGETVTSGGHPMRLEHAGRSEFKNFVLGDTQYDAVNHDIEIRDLFNAEDAFRLEPYYLEAYRARVNANLARHDSLDGKTAWPLSDRGEHPLTEFLLADFLVVDVAKPFTEHSYLEIDRALLTGRPHTTCGGRPPNDDIVDAFLTLMISGVDGAPISDGVDHATEPATSAFPYLVAPNQDPPQVRPPSAPPQEH
jgi:Domain of unknown function (DUF4331)